jgi:dipeptidase E
MRLLLLSNSTNKGDRYLGHAGEAIQSFLGKSVMKAVFIPYAAVTITYEEYEQRVRERFLELGYDILSIHRFSDPVAALMNAEAIIAGGGNTWQLLSMIRRNSLTGIIRRKVRGGTPYIGWSAGSNLACPTIMTTNDMPVVNPGSFRAAALIPFQINPHYTEAGIPGHGGETRMQRIEEFISANRGIRVAGLREGTMLIREGNRLKLAGPEPLKLFMYGQAPSEFYADDDLSFLLKKNKQSIL